MIKTTVESQWNGEAIRVRGERTKARSIWEIGLDIEARTKLMCPVDTGRLRASYTTQASDRGTAMEGKALGGDEVGKPSSADEVVVGTNVEYAPYAEAGRPHLRPAVDLVQGRALTIVMNAGRMEFKEYLRQK